MLSTIFVVRFLQWSKFSCWKLSFISLSLIMWLQFEVECEKNAKMWRNYMVLLYYHLFYKLVIYNIHVMQFNGSFSACSTTKLIWWWTSTLRLLFLFLYLALNWNDFSYSLGELIFIMVFSLCWDDAMILCFQIDYPWGFSWSVLMIFMYENTT